MKTKLFNIFVTIVLLVNGVGMIKLGDRLVSYVDGTLTNALEIEQLRQDLNRVGPTTDVVTGWLPNGGDSPQFREIKAQRGVFDIPPISGSAYTLSGQELVGAGASQPLVFDVGYYDSNSILIPYGTLGTKFQLNPIYIGRGVNSLNVFANVDMTDGLDGYSLLSLVSYKKTDDTPVGSLSPGFGATIDDWYMMSFSAVMSIDKIEELTGLSADQVYFQVLMYTATAGSYTILSGGLGANIIR